MARPCCARLACVVQIILAAIALSAGGFAQATVSGDGGISTSGRTLGPTLERPVYFASSSPMETPVAPAFDSTIYARPRQHSQSHPANYNLLISVLGLGAGFPNFELGAQRPNANLAVGDTEVVQAADFAYADFNKSTGAIIALNGLSSTPGNTVWKNLLPNSACGQNNDGELIVQFDHTAHRWILVQDVFEPPHAVCIAISQTATFSDNLWFAYQFPVPLNNHPDYQKFAVWSTGYFQTMNMTDSTNMFVGAAACGYNSQKLLAGDPTAEQICFQLSSTDSSLLPADIDSPTPPPANEDEFFIGSVGAVDNAHLSLYSFHVVDFPTNTATFTGTGNSQLLPIAAFTPACNPNYMGDCVQETGPFTGLQSLGDRLMYRFAYFSDAGSFSAIPVTALSVFQQGTYAGAPPDGSSRWMGSIAGSGGDILLGYSVSSLEQFPSIAVAGRVASDPLGTLETESVVVSGTGSQIASPWGGYSAMRIDPFDSRIFWYTTEYYKTTGMMDWSTQLVSLMFASGGTPFQTQHWYVNFDVGNSDGSVGVRWMELTPMALVTTQTAVTSLPNPSTYLEQVTISASVTPSGCTGTVDFVDTFNGPPTTLCAGVPLDMNGTAMCLTSALATGTHSQLVASYSGNNQCAGSQGTDTPAQVVDQASTTTVLTANPSSPSMFGQQVTFTATVTGMNGGSPTGFVSYTDNGAGISSCIAQPLTPQANGSTATCQISTLTVGLHNICGTYSGDPNYLISSNCISYQVNLPSTVVTLSVTPNMTSAGHVVTLTAAVTSNGIPVNVGTVTFFSGTQALGTVQVVGLPQRGRPLSPGTATLLSRFAPGTYSLTAQYNQNSNFAGGMSLPQPLTVTGAEPTISTLSAQPDNNNYDFTLSVFGFGYPPPAGSATVNNQTQHGTLIGNIPVPATGMPGFQPVQSFPAGSSPISVATGDFNNDGIQDLAVLNLEDSTVSILLGNGDGTFHSHGAFSTGESCGQVIVGDFNADGNLDLAVACTPNGVGVLFGDGTGGFGQAQFYQLEAFPIAIAMGDFNSDGSPDLVIAGSMPGGAGIVEVLLNNGDGTFTPLDPVPAGLAGQAIAVADLDNNGTLDAAVADSGGNQVLVLLGDGQGHLMLPQTYPAGNFPAGIAIGQLTNSGHLDLVVTNQNDSTVSVLLGNGHGTFQPQPPAPAGQAPVGIAIAPFTISGHADLIVASSGDNTARLLPGNGTGSFPTQLSFSTGGAPMGLAVADLNGDGFPDVVTANSSSNNSSVLIGGTISTGQLLNAPVFGNGSQNVQSSFTPTSNFYASSVSNIVTVIGTPQIATTTMLMSRPNPSNLGQMVTLTATVTYSDGFPTGQVLFQSNGGPIAECMSPVMLNSSGVATCTTSSLPAGSDIILASFSDPSGTFANSSAMLTQTVQIAGDFEILPITPGSITVTQSYSNLSDPFFSHPVGVTVHGLNGYAGTVMLSCSLSPALPGGSCVVNSPNSGMVDADLVTSLTISAGAASPIGNYTVIVTGMDNNGLMHQAEQNLTVIQNGPAITMVKGGTGGPVLINFPGIQGGPIGNFQCPLVNGTGLNGNQPFSMIGGICNFNPTTGTIPGPIQVTFIGCTIARLHTHMPIYASLFFGLPGFVLLAPLAGATTRRRKWLQIIGLLLMLGATLFAAGCGGYGQLTPSGHYQVLVQATGNDGTVYSAEVPVTVTSLP